MFLNLAASVFLAWQAGQTPSIQPETGINHDNFNDAPAAKPDPKDATIAAQAKLIEWHEKREALLLEMLLQKIKAETQAMQDRLNELDKQKPNAPTEAKKPIGQ